MVDWRSFEARVKQESELQGITCVKVPEHMGMGGGRIFRKKTEFDYCAGIDGIAAFFDCKITGRKDFNFKTYVIQQEKVHQFNALRRAQDNLNIAGYLIYFYEQRTVVWVNMKLVGSLLDAGVKAITVNTPAATTQLDDVPINLRTLMWEDRANVVRKLCKP